MLSCRNEAASQKAMDRQDFLNPRVHIGWIAALTIALLGKGIATYFDVIDIQKTQTTDEAAQTRAMDKMERDIDQLRNHPCQKN
jgi:hypothetical protein